jgi:hypothetical protein
MMRRSETPREAACWLVDRLNVPGRPEPEDGSWDVDLDVLAVPLAVTSLSLGITPAMLT